MLMTAHNSIKVKPAAFFIPVTDMTASGMQSCSYYIWAAVQNKAK
jgi:hypothetical protein